LPFNPARHSFQHCIEAFCNLHLIRGLCAAFADARTNLSASEGQESPGEVFLDCVVYTQKKNQEFLESSIFSVKTSPSLENPSLENKVQLLSRNFEDRTFGAFWSTVKYE